MRGERGLSRETFARELRRFDRETLASFVADLWERRGWRTAVDGARVAAERDAGNPQSLALLAVPADADVDSPDAPVDVVVAGGRAREGAAALAARLDADLCDPDDLYDATRYAIGREASKSLLWEYVGHDAVSDAAPLPTRLRRFRPSAHTAGAVALVLIALVAAAATGVRIPLPGGDASPAAIEPATVRGTIHPDERPARSDVALAAGNGTGETRGVVHAFPTCERTPGQVVRVQIEALRWNASGTRDGLRVMWRFLSPRAIETFGSFAKFSRAVPGSLYAPLLSASAVRYGPAVRSGNVARQRVSVASAAAEQLTYEFRLVRQTTGRFEGCWLVDRLDPRSVFDPGSDDAADGSATNSDRDPFADVTCDRSPGDVVTAFVRAVERGGPETDAGLRAVWHLLTPSIRETYDTPEAFVRGMESRPYSTLLEAGIVEYGRVPNTDDAATDGDDRRASYGLRLAAVGEESCWRVGDVEVAETGARRDDRRNVDGSTVERAARGRLSDGVSPAERR